MADESPKPAERQPAGGLNPSSSWPQPLVDAREQAQRRVEQGDAFLARNQVREAAESYQSALRLQPDNSLALCRLAHIAWQLGQKSAARGHAAEAARIDPACALAHHLLAQFAIDLGNMDQAMLHSARALELAPDEPEVAVTRAWALQNIGQGPAAWELIKPLVDRQFMLPQLGLVYRRIARTVGQEGQSLAYIQRLLEASQLPRIWRAQLHLAAAALLESLGRYDEAFEQATLGKRCDAPPYDPRQVSEWVDAQIAYFTRERLGRLPRASLHSRRPAFILGMPRSGTSLVEQIAASHPDVHGAGELYEIGIIANGTPRIPWARGHAYPGYLDVMQLPQANEMANAYLGRLAVINNTAARVTNKMPHNFMYLSLIAILFPDSPVIHCTRDPMDTCVSCYMTFFNGGQPSSHQLSHLAAYYLDYHRLMRHWQSVLNIRMIDVSYEDLVADHDREARRIIQHLDLPWDDRCLRFYENARTVHTGSIDQVRRPIYSSSIGRWKKYAAHLNELTSALEPLI